MLNSHLNPTRTGSCYNNQLVDLKEASWPTGNQGCGFRGNLRKISRKNSQKLAWCAQAVPHLKKLENEVPRGLSDVKLDLMSNSHTPYTPETRSHPSTLSLRTPTDQHHWLGCHQHRHRFTVAEGAQKLSGPCPPQKKEEQHLRRENTGTVWALGRLSK